MKFNPNELKFYREDPVDQSQIDEIADSFKTHGQRHPVTVHLLNGKEPKVIAGRRRVLAARQIGWLEIECEVIERNLHATEIESISLHENLRRTNLPWHDRAILVERLHSLQQAIHGTANPKGGGGPIEEGAKREKSGWSLRDTQSLLNTSLGTLSADIQLARAIKLNPSLTKVKDRKTAIKLVRIEAQRIESEQGAGVKVSGMEDHNAFCDDSANILKQLPDKTFHLCITDPPWIKFYDSKYKIDERTKPVFKELFRVMRWDSLLYMFCGLDDYNYYAGTERWSEEAKTFVHENGLLEDLGWKVSKTPVLWIKGKSLSRRGVSSWEYARNFEFILLAAKGSPTLTSQTQLEASLNYDAVPPVKLVHPNEKPISLIRRLLQDSSYEGNYVIDPFAGSFVLADAAKREKRRFVVIERDREVYEKGCRRVGIDA